MRIDPPRLAGLLSLSLAAAASPAAAQLVVDPTFTLTATLSFSGAQSARFDPSNPAVRWIGRRAGASSDGVYRVGFADRVVLAAPASNPAGVLVDPITGEVFFSEDFGGLLYHVSPMALGTRSTWVSGFAAGDDDPVGMAIAPPLYVGGAVRPGEAVVVDRGANGSPDGVWVWSSTIAQVQRLLVPDSSALVDPVDVTFDAGTLYLADTGDAGGGHIWRVGAAGALTELLTAPAMSDPMAVRIDPLTQELLVLDAASDRLLAFDPATGVGREVVTGLSLNADEWSSLDVRPDGSELLITSGGLVYTLSRCTLGLTPANDCDGDGVLDRCQLAAGVGSDCNGNGALDGCDISRGTSADCEGDGVPDECPVCPPVELVVFFDTSASMDDEAAALCNQVSSIRGEFAARGMTVNVEILGIDATPGGNYACLQDHVINRYGTTVPGTPPVGNEVLGMCPGGNEAPSEDWGRATSVVAGRKLWSAGAVRVVVPIADEGPWCGDPVTTLDNDSITHAIATATTAGVRVSPIAGTGTTMTVAALAAALAAGTGGVHQQSTASNTDIPRSLVDLVRSACFASTDCNANQVGDSCDLAAGTSADCDHDGIPDECQAVVVCPPDAGVTPDAAPTADAGDEDAAEADAAIGDAGTEPADAEPLDGADATMLEDTGLADATPPADAAPTDALLDSDAALADAIPAGDADATAAGDAGVPRDASAIDARAEADAAAPMEPDSDGCGCTAAHPDLAPAAPLGGLALGALLFLGRSRRRSGAAAPPAPRGPDRAQPPPAPARVPPAPPAPSPPRSRA